MSVICPCCDGSVYEGSVGVYNSEISHQEYSRYHCEACDCEFWWPLEILPEVYEGELEWQYELKHQILEQDTDKGRLPFKYTYIRGVPCKGGKLLDIGCSNGKFLKYAEEIGFEVWGIDIDRKAIEAAIASGLTRVKCISLDDFLQYALKEGVRFDVVTMWDVLEHLNAPRDYIKKISSLLKESGFIAGTVPNRNRILAGASRVNSTGDYPPHHLTWWSAASLHNFLDGNGFGEVTIDFMPVGLRNIISDLQKAVGPAEHLKGLLKRRYYKRNDAAKLPLEYLEEAGNGAGRLIRILKSLRNAVFFPVAVGMYPFVRRKSKMFFYGKKQ